MNELKRKTLCQLGLSPMKTGFWYAADALHAVHSDPQALTSLTKHVYPVVAEHFSVSPAAVESGLRRAVDTCWRKNPDLLEVIMEETLPKRPTVGQFLAAMTLYIWYKDK